MSTPLPLSSFCMMVMDGAYGWVGCERDCDEDWPWRGESESERCVSGMGTAWKKGKSRVCRKEGREIETSIERWRRQREQDGEKTGRWVEEKGMKRTMYVGLGALLLRLGGCSDPALCLGLCLDNGSSMGLIQHQVMRWNIIGKAVYPAKTKLYAFYKSAILNKKTPLIETACWCRCAQPTATVQFDKLLLLGLSFYKNKIAPT